MVQHVLQNSENIFLLQNNKKNNSERKTQYPENELFSMMDIAGVFVCLGLLTTVNNKKKIICCYFNI